MEGDIRLDKVEFNFLGTAIRLDLLRTDLYDDELPGNKYWKLKYNIEEMKKQGKEHLVTFGGAFSNHIAATAAAGKKYGFKTTGIIRGEPESNSNPTLMRAGENGMEFRFIDREKYRDWKFGKTDLTDILGEGDYYVVPEGGSNELAVKGCSEILSGIENKYDIIACPVGTGATLAGLILAAKQEQKVLGFSSMKGGEYIEDHVKAMLVPTDRSIDSLAEWSINHSYHFGGYARATRTSIQFFRNFKEQTGIELDLVYTVKMMYGLSEMIKFGEIPAAQRILAIHTGGQQGNRSMLERFKGLWV